jgi:ArsR family transcriptional regulator
LSDLKDKDIISINTDITMNTIPTVSRLKALADASRLRILGLLGREELSVGELTAVLGMAQSRVSGHLAILREAGLVRDRREGTSAFYSLAPENRAVETWNAIRSADPDLSLSAADRRRLGQALRRRRERSREFFDRAAAAWDAGRSESLGYHAGGFALAGLLPEGLTVLDLGTGTGSLLPFLGRYLDRVVAVDMSRGMLARARERLSTDEESMVRLLRADVERLPLPNGSVDGVVANMILHHLPHPESVLREAGRVLGPRGRGVIVDFAAHDEQWLMDEEGHRWAGFDPAQIGGWCVDAGLTVPEFQPVPTPDTGRWSRLEVFVARFGRAGTTERADGSAH